MRLPLWTIRRAFNGRTSSSPEIAPLNSLQASRNSIDPSAKTTVIPSSWSPIYLSPASLAAFSIIFLACLASVQVLLAVSNQHTGLPGGNDSLHRVLWSYGPAAIVTLVSSFWARLEIQTKSTAPWFSMAQGNNIASRSLLLDYTSQLQPTSIFSALRHKNFTVAGATVVSLLLKVLLVLATSLITLSPATSVRHHSVSLSLKSEFINNSSGLTANGSLAAANFALMMNFNTPLPEGVSDTYAYQIVESDLLDTPYTLNTTVHGFLGGLECEEAELSVGDVFWDNNGLQSNFHPRIPITAGSCTFQVRTLDILINSNLEQSENGYHVVGLDSGTCDDSDSKDSQRLAIIVAVLESPREDTFTIARSNSLMCTPTYQILPLDLTAQGPARLLQPSGPNFDHLSNVHPWDIMQSHLNSNVPSPSNEGAVNISHQTVWFDEFGYLAYQFANRSGNGPTLFALFDDPIALAEFFSNYYQQYSALLAHTSLMQPASISSKGSADGVTNRFLVHSLIANSMTAVFTACLIIGICIWITRASRKLTLPHNPTTIIGLAICLSSSETVIETFSGMGNSAIEDLQAVLDGCNYRSCFNKYDGNFEVLAEERLLPNDDLETLPLKRSFFNPLSLKVSVRLTAVTIFLAINICLEVTLRLSERNQGLGDVPRDSEIISYSWTALPALILTLIGMYCSSVDFDTRSLVPFLHLVGGSGFASSVGLDLVNKHTFLLLYEELKTRSVEALASTLAVALTSLLTIFSTGLFTSVIGTSNVPIELRVVNPIWYDIKGAVVEAGRSDYSMNSAALVLANNLSYPSFTYEDLILPTLKVDETFLSSHSNTSAIEFRTTLLAARPSFAQCRIFDSSHIHFNFTSWEDYGVRVNIESEECGLYSPEFHGNLMIPIIGRDSGDVQSNLSEAHQLPLEADFGVSKANWAEERGCSQRLWLWGRWTTSTVQQGNFPEVLSVSALACNESMETVEVEASLFGPDLSVKPSQPPIPHQSAVSSVDIQQHLLSGFDLYASLPTLSSATTERLLDNFFTLLTTSRYALPLDMLGNESHTSTVADSIKFHHNIIAAQRIAGISGRYDTEPTRDQDYQIVPGTNDTSSYNCTSSIPLDHLRVVQDEFSTRVLQGLLIGTLICFLSNWYLIHTAGGCGVIPRNPNTIANVAALLAEGNLIERSRLINGQSLGLQAVRDHLGRDTVFRLGWCRIPGREEQVYCIYADNGSYDAVSSRHADESDSRREQWEMRSSGDDARP